MKMEENLRGQIRSLTRDIGTVTAALQREQERRAAAIARSKEMEETAADAEMSLRQTRYANRKLEDEIRRLNRALQQSEARYREPPNMGNISPSSGDGTLEKKICDNFASSPAKRSYADASPNKTNTSYSQAVESAVQELQAVVPQYRGTITSLQGRIKVLQGKIEMMTQERDSLREEVKHWREAAEKQETTASNALAKLETQEATSVAHMTSSQSKISRLEHELSEIKQKYDAAEKRAKYAESKALHLSESNESQSKIIDRQCLTIASLEKTVREQQDDILAALDLVSYRSIESPLNSFNYQKAQKSAENLVSFEGKNAKNIDNEVNKIPIGNDGALHDIKSSSIKLEEKAENQSPTAIMLDELETIQNWKIPARKSSNSEVVTALQTEEMLEKDPEQSNEIEPANMDSMAAEIAALREALRVALP